MYFSKDADSVPTFESPWIHQSWTPAASGEVGETTGRYEKNTVLHNTPCRHIWLFKVCTCVTLILKYKHLKKGKEEISTGDRQ